MGQWNATLHTEEERSSSLSPAAQAELHALGLDALAAGGSRDPVAGLDAVESRPIIKRRAIRAPQVLNEASDYWPLPSSFSRGLSIDLPGARLLLLSGTASVDEDGKTIHVGDLEAQCLRTYRNLTALLVAEDASWHDVVRTTCYLRDIERDYDAFNKVRTLFLEAVGLDPLPASTGIQAKLCRPELLVEIEAMAIVPQEDQG